MKFFKTLFSILILFLFLFCTNNLFAQYPGMGAFRAQQSQQFINHQTQMMNNLRLMTNSRYSSYQELEYQVQYKDSAIKKVTSYMFYDTLTKKSFLIYVNKKFPKSDTLHRYEKIYPENTLKILAPITLERYGEKIEVNIEGMANDTCWVFKVLAGSISLHGKSTDYLFYYNSQFSFEAEIIPSLIVGIQLKDGPILKYNLENLTNFMADNQKCLKLLQNKKFFKAINRYNADKVKETKK